jgi:hypothetical protein
MSQPAQQDEGGSFDDHQYAAGAVYVRPVAGHDYIE